MLKAVPFRYADGLRMATMGISGISGIRLRYKMDLQMLISTGHDIQSGI